MKTLTEFSVSNLRNIAKTKQDLVAGGKTAEELPAALGEALKMEGDKLGFLMNALTMTEGKLDDLKRVVVFTLAEGEKAPAGSQPHGEQIYLAEYFPPLAPKGGQPGRDDRHPRGAKGGRGDGKGKGRGKPRGGDRDGRGGGGGGRRPPRRDAAAPAGGADRPAPPIPKPRNPEAPKPSET